MNLLKAIFAASLFFLTGIFTSAFAQAKSDSTAILHQAERWVEAAKEENADDLARIYTKDAILLPPGSPPIKGRANIRSLFAEQFARLDATIEFHTQELVVAGEWAYRWGYYVITAETQDENELRIKDKYLEIWNRGPNGQWLIARDIWNRTESVTNK